MTEPINHTNPHMVYGLWDFGVGQVEEGWFDIRELDIIENYRGDVVQQDPEFATTHPLSVFRKAADAYGHITESESVLKKYARIKPNSPKPQ